MKKFRQTEEELNKESRKVDIDYEQMNKKKSKPKKNDPFPNIDAYMQEKKENEKTLEIDEDKNYELHSIRTTKNVQDFLTDMFLKRKRSVDLLTMGYQIYIIDVIPNNALTVFNIIWEFPIFNMAENKIDQDNYENIIAKLSSNFTKVFSIILY